MTSLPLMEAFYTIQGEGFHQGKAAYFIRLGGCDVGCVWCDVKESWDAENHPLTDVERIAMNAEGSGAPFVVVTGGEPLMYNMDELTKQLHSSGLRVHVETSGAYPLSGQWDWITYSPKKFKTPVDDIAKYANELKIIVYNKSDFDWAEDYAKKVNKDCLLYLQPEWSKEKEVMPMIIDYVKQHPKWQISIQTHKFMNIP